MVLLRSIGLICCGHRAIALENLALRQQLAVLRRTVARPRLRSTDRLFWILLAKSWRDWRSALIVVQPDTVVRWHRQWLRRHWTQVSQRRRPGRPTTISAIRTLVSTMATANPLWGAPRIHGELAKLGITVSERTVSRLLRPPRRPPSQTSRTFHRSRQHGQLLTEREVLQHDCPVPAADQSDGSEEHHQRRQHA